MSAYSVGRRTCFKGFKRRQIKDRLSRQEPNGGACLSEQLQALSTSTVTQPWLQRLVTTGWLRQLALEGSSKG